MVELNIKSYVSLNNNVLYIYNIEYFKMYFAAEKRSLNINI